MRSFQEVEQRMIAMDDMWLFSGTSLAEVGCHVLLKAKTHYLVFLYQCLQYSRA